MPFLLAFRQQPSCCVLTWPLNVWREKALISSYKDTNPFMETPSSWPHLNLIPFQRPYLPYEHTGGLELQHMNLGRIQTFSINRILSVKMWEKIWPQIQKAHDLSNLTLHHKSNWLSHEVIFTFSPTYLSNLKTYSTSYLEDYFYFSFIFGCTESLLLFTGFLSLQWVGATFCYNAQASHCGGVSCCGSL